MSVADKVLLLKNDFDAVYEAGKSAGGITEPYAIYSGISSSGYTKIETVNMVSIPKGFMNGMNSGNTVEKLILNEGVRNLYQSSIYACPSLTEVVFPKSSLKQIFAWVFNACTSLNDITLPKSITTLYNGIFASCSGLTNFDVEDGFNCNLPLGHCSNISQESVLNILSHYKSNSGKTLTLHKNVAANWTEDELKQLSNDYGVTIAVAT